MSQVKKWWTVIESRFIFHSGPMGASAGCWLSIETLLESRLRQGSGVNREGTLRHQAGGNKTLLLLYLIHCGFDIRNDAITYDLDSAEEKRSDCYLPTLPFVWRPVRVCFHSPWTLPADVIVTSHVQQLSVLSLYFVPREVAAVKRQNMMENKWWINN